MTTTCRDCEAWERNPFHGCFNSICDECKARHIAQGPSAWASVVRGDKEPLRLDIQRAFGERSLTDGRALVWKWCQRLNVGKAKSEATPA